MSAWEHRGDEAAEQAACVATHGTPREFTPEFKAGAVKLVLAEGKPTTQVAQDLDLTESALRIWVQQAKADRAEGKSGALATA